MAAAGNVPAMTVELPDAPVAAAGLTADEARLRVAFALYREGRLSTRQCAELCGLSRTAFMDQLARHRVEAPYGLADLEADAATLKQLGRQ
jgi:predicted HTH domain antitoxin